MNTLSSCVKSKSRKENVLKKLKIEKCVDCPRFKSCKHHNKKTRFAIATVTGTVNIHPSCDLEDFDNTQQMHDAINLLKELNDVLYKSNHEEFYNKFRYAYEKFANEQHHA